MVHIQQVTPVFMLSGLPKKDGRGRQVVLLHMGRHENIEPLTLRLERRSVVSLSLVPNKAPVRLDITPLTLYVVIYDEKHRIETAVSYEPLVVPFCGDF